MFTNLSSLNSDYPELRSYESPPGTLLFCNAYVRRSIMNYNESAEDYLEAILMLREQLGKVRSIDIVYKLGYSKPSISIAMKKLREKGLVHMDENGYITLTDEGLKIARHTYNRHKVITTFFESIGVNTSTAEHDACKIEHDISDETFKRLKEHMHANNLNGRQIRETIDVFTDE